MRKLKKKVQKKWDRRKNHDAEMRKEKYVTPPEAAKIGGVSASTVYGWVHRSKLKEVGGKKPVVHRNGVIWILAASVKLLCPDATELARA